MRSVCCDGDRGKDAARGMGIPMAWQHGGPGQAYGRWLGATTETSTSLLLNVGVLRGVCGVGFEGGRFLLNNGFRGSNLAGKGLEEWQCMVLGDQG